MEHSNVAAHGDSMASALAGIGDKIENLYAQSPSLSLSLAEGLQNIVAALNNYRTCAGQPDTDFNVLRRSSRNLSEAITAFRYHVLKGMDGVGDESVRGSLSNILDATLTGLWDPHIQHDMAFFTAGRAERAGDALAAPFLGMEEWLTIIRTMVDEVAKTVTGLEAQPVPRPVRGKPLLRVVK